MLVLCGCATYSSAGDSWKYVGDFGGAEVFVVVESGGGFGGQLHRAGLAGNGRFSLVGAYSDTTTVRKVVESNVALAFINDLLAIDFMGQPEVFRNVRGEASATANGQLVLRHTETVDSGIFRISLHVGTKAHTVTLQLPAYGAPEALLDWMNRFRELVREQASWVAF